MLFLRDFFYINRTVHASNVDNSNAAYTSQKELITFSYHVSYFILWLHVLIELKIGKTLYLQYEVTKSRIFI